MCVCLTLCLAIKVICGWTTKINSNLSNSAVLHRSDSQFQNKIGSSSTLITLQKHPVISPQLLDTVVKHLKSKEEWTFIIIILYTLSTPISQWPPLQPSHQIPSTHLWNFMTHFSTILTCKTQTYTRSQRHTKSWSIERWPECSRPSVRSREQDIKSHQHQH